MQMMATEKDESTLNTGYMFKISVEEQDERLFGSLNSEIAGALADCVWEAIVSGVESLPLVSDQEKCRALEQEIGRTCMRNIDIMEAYGSRNIFTLRNYPRRRRLRVVQHALDETSLQDALKKSDTTEDYIDVVRHQSATLNLPSDSERPSFGQMNELEHELVELQDKLNAARLLRDELTSKYHGLESANTVSYAAVTSLLEVSTGDVASPVNQVVSSGKRLRQLSNEGKEMIRQLDTTKKERNSDEENDGIPASMKKQTKRKRLSMEEEYKLDREVLHSKNVASLNVLRSMLRP